MKNVDTIEYLSVMEELIDCNEAVPIPVSGFSMNPFLAHQRDMVMVRKPGRDLKRGDIVLFKRPNGHYVLHRIWKRTKEGYYIVGDAQTEIEGPVQREQIIGRVDKIRRKGRWIDERDPLWIFFEKAWIRIVPARPFLRKGYSLISRIWSKG